MDFQHSWSFKKVFGHPMNPNCVYKIVANLNSTNNTTSLTSEHTFYLAPNILPEISSEEEVSKEEVSNEIIWMDSLPSFVNISNLTEDLLWEWIDANEDRHALELANERQLPADVQINLPFVTDLIETLEDKVATLETQQPSS